MFICKRCSKTIRRVEDVRNCATCSPQAASIPETHSDADDLTPAILGYVIGSMDHDDRYSSSDPAPDFSGGGGSFGGAGASSSWDSGSSSDSSSSYDSGSGSSDSSSSSSSD